MTVERDIEWCDLYQEWVEELAGQVADEAFTFGLHPCLERSLRAAVEYGYRQALLEIAGEEESE